MNSRKENAERTKQDLLDAALIIFSKKGFNATRLEDISQKAGVTRGAFYWHFKNKTEIFCELHRKIMGDLYVTMISATNSSLSALTNLKNILHTIIVQVINDQKSKRCSKLYYANENSPNLTKALVKLKKGIEPKIRGFFSNIIDKGKKENEIRNDIDTISIFRSTVVTLNGTIIQIFNGIHTYSEGDINSIINIFIDGIKKKK